MLHTYINIVMNSSLKTIQTCDCGRNISYISCYISNTSFFAKAMVASLTVNKYLQLHCVFFFLILFFFINQQFSIHRLIFYSTFEESVHSSDKISKQKIQEGEVKFGQKRLLLLLWTALFRDPHSRSSNPVSSTLFCHTTAADSFNFQFFQFNFY